VIALCVDPETKSYFQTQDIEFDGLVVKLSDPKQRTLLGTTNHHPRRAIAYKFPAQQVSTRLLDVHFQVGRTGILTPVAILEPVALSGVTISRSSLHNESFILQKQIHKGDYIILQRSGEVIPYII
jgi:DNA ligase (NAD+)